MKRSTYQKIYEALSTSSQKHLSADMLAQIIGIYPDVINEAMSLFNPLVSLDTTFNLKELQEPLETYLKGAKSLPTKRIQSRKSKALPYTTFADFVYEKMTIAGIVDKGIILSDKDLRLAKKLIMNELKSRKK